ncbi:hypothetical protein EDD15DRAFT_2153532 [Pisolithus albus]|nr:hypothetical protein EDD15DRAFT_2153532 [Pisolithus albus]
MSTTKYHRLPHSDDDNDNNDDGGDDTRPQATSGPSQSTPRRLTDPRFNPPPPPIWKRVALIALIIFLFWLSYSLRRTKKNAQQDIIYASRYSKEFKYRPAASPIITERLKDGRVRLRGAYPTG